MKESMLGIVTTKDQLETDVVTITYVMVKEPVVMPDGVKVPPDHPKIPIIITMKPLQETNVIDIILIRIIIVMETELAAMQDGAKEHQDD